jgi:hypothetical protein
LIKKYRKFNRVGYPSDTQRSRNEKMLNRRSSESTIIEKL